MTLGTYPAMSLVKANEALAAAQASIEQGDDPGEEAISARRAEREAETFKELVDEWIERWAKPNRKRWIEAKQTLEYDAIPAFGKTKVRDIRRRDIIKLLDNIVDRGAPTAANRNLSLLRQLFRFAVQRDMIQSSPCEAIDHPAKEKPRERVLSEEEIRTVWNKLPTVGVSRRLELILKFCLATAQRRGEVINARKDEFQGDWWTIPGERTKSGRDHRTPLSPLTKEILAELISMSGDSEYICPGRNGHLSADYVTAKLWAKVDNFGIPRFTVHDLRRTAASHMTGLGITRFDVGKVLNHAETGVTAVYDRYGYDKEKRKALNAWSRKLQAITSGEQSDNVVTFR